MNSTVIKLESVSKRFTLGGKAVDALKDVSLEIPRGKLVAIVGPSGSGKSTMLNLLGGLDRPSKGKVEVDGQPIHSLSEGELVQYHRQKVGYIFQSFNLIPNLSALENVELPLEFAKQKSRGKRAQECMRMAELPEDRWRHHPAQLSGGEQQRVAIARALAIDPPLILADEPTGNLDSKTGEQILDVFKRLVQNDGRTIVMITHDREVAQKADIVLQLKDGELVQVQHKNQ